MGLHTDSCYEIRASEVSLIDSNLPESLAKSPAREKRAAVNLCSAEKSGELLHGLRQTQDLCFECRFDADLAIVFSRLPIDIVLPILTDEGRRVVSLKREREVKQINELDPPLYIGGELRRTLAPQKVTRALAEASPAGAAVTIHRSKRRTHGRRSQRNPGDQQPWTPALAG